MCNNTKTMLLKLSFENLPFFLQMSVVFIAMNFDSTPLTVNSEKLLLPIKKSSLPICIVGAGISGLSLGNLLQNKNERVIILEKFDKAGGKISTFRHNDLVQVGTGPVAFVPGHTSLIKYIKKFNLTPIPFNDSRVLAFEPYTGAVFPVREILYMLKGPMLKAARRYGLLQSEYARSHKLDFGYLEASKCSEMFWPISKWLDYNKLASLKPSFRFIMTQEGYGALEDTPALYALKLVDGPMLIDVALNPNGGLKIVEEGYDVLVNKMAESLDIKLGQEVVTIRRNLQNVNLSSEVTTKNYRGQLETYQCKKVVLAFPPLLSQLGKVVTDLTTEEKHVLGQVRVHKYTTAVHHIPAWREAIYASVGAGFPNFYFDGIMGNGNVILFAKQSLKKLDSVYSSYSWIRGQFTELPSEQEFKLIERKLMATLRQINGGHLEGVTTFVRPTQTHPYFPHVNTTALKQGFYKKFDKIQGLSGLYYATTLLGFEIMDAAIKMTEDFVEKYF